MSYLVVGTWDAAGRILRSNTVATEPEAVALVDHLKTGLPPAKRCPDAFYLEDPGVDVEHLVVDGPGETVAVDVTARKQDAFAARMADLATRFRKEIARGVEVDLGAGTETIDCSTAAREELDTVARALDGGTWGVVTRAGGVLTLTRARAERAREAVDVRRAGLYRVEHEHASALLALLSDPAKDASWIEAYDIDAGWQEADAKAAPFASIQKQRKNKQVRELRAAIDGLAVGSDAETAAVKSILTQILNLM